MSCNEKTPAVAGTTTDSKETISGSPYTYDYTTEKQFCQVLLNSIVESAETIRNNASDEEIVLHESGVIAGMVYGLRCAWRLIQCPAQYTTPAAA